MIQILDISKYFNKSIIEDDSAIRAALPSLIADLIGGTLQETMYIISLENIDFLLDNYFIDQVIMKILNFRDKDKEFIILSDMSERNYYNLQQFIIAKNKVAHENNKVYPMLIRKELLVFAGDTIKIDYNNLSQELVSLAGEPTLLVLDTFLKTFRFPLGFSKQEFEDIFGITIDQARSRLARSVATKIIREKKTTYKNTAIFRNSIFFGS